MLEFSNNPRLPPRYRLVLTISLALFAHSLIGAGLAVLLSQRSEPEAIRLDVTLVAPGSEAATQAAQPDTADRRMPVSRQIRPEQITSSQSPASAPAPAEKQEVQQKASPATPPVPEKQTPTEDTSASAAVPADPGQSSPVQGKEEAEVSQITRLERVETPPYLQKLQTRIAAELGRTGIEVPTGADRYRAGTVELQLRLLANGALVDAEIVESSGNEGLDRSYLRAALRASPFPRPPEEDRAGGFRYRVRMLYQPPTSG